jgi:hypothetical protein
MAFARLLAATDLSLLVTCPRAGSPSKLGSRMAKDIIIHEIGPKRGIAARVEAEARQPAVFLTPG